MKRQNDPQVMRLKTLTESKNDDGDEDDRTSASSISFDNDSDKSSVITTLMRENEQKIRNLSESYLNRFLIVGQQAQTLPELSNALTLQPIMKPIISRKSSATDLDSISSTPSLTLFIETMKQLVVKEEKKRG